jgi:hypothetical protein
VPWPSVPLRHPALRALALVFTSLESPVPLDGFTAKAKVCSSIVQRNPLALQLGYSLAKVLSIFRSGDPSASSLKSAKTFFGHR